MGLDEKIKELVSVIAKTNEFEEFKNAKADISKYKGLMNEIESLEKKQQELYKLKMQGKEAKFFTQEVNDSFVKLSQIPEVQKLLKTRNNFNNMILNLYKTINTSIDTEFKK